MEMTMQLRHLALAGTMAAVTIASGCAAPDEAGSGASSSSGGQTSSVGSLTKDDAIAAKLPAAIKSSGTVRVASGVSFPPMEFFDTDNKTVLGFDADLGAALGQVLGVKFEFQNTNFDGIIGGLDAGLLDVGGQQVGGCLVLLSLTDRLRGLIVGSGVVLRRCATGGDDDGQSGQGDG
jgi:polar amino acid transport system substrate-binding protein